MAISRRTVVRSLALVPLSGTAAAQTASEKPMLVYVGHMS